MFWWLSIDKVSCLLLMVMSLLNFLLGIYFFMCDYVIFIEWELFYIHSSSVVMALLFDWMSLIFMGFVMFISSLIVKYSGEYMQGDICMDRFIILVLLFVLSMMFLILSPNIISILLGWDGLGLISYCLVIYYQNVKSYNAGMLTALSNRVGDVALLMVVVWMSNVGSWNYIYYLNLFHSKQWGLLLIALVILAAMTSSAQIPFSSWLPAAMAAPTPVSALVHSSTLVTAGVYLLIRFNALVIQYYEVSNFLIVMGMLTMFMSGMGAIFEYDLKKIIALSTLSQLGLMMSVLGMGASKLAFFHLLTHALFKALLFMCAGVVIHNMLNCQDIRYMGGLSRGLPVTTGCLNIANLALCGMPFLAGFYSSDLILEYVMLSEMNMFIFFLFLFCTGLTVCYSLRLSYYSMTGEFNFFSVNNIEDRGGPMLNMMVVLMFMAIMGGCMLSWVFFTSPIMICLPFKVSGLTILVSLVGGSIGYLLSMMYVYWLVSLSNYFSVFFLGSMWFMPSLSTCGLNRVSFLMWGETFLKVIDHGWSEQLGAQGLHKSLVYGSVLLQQVQDNSLSIYLLGFFMLVVALMLWGLSF
nr:NADH dehydrogenase subunit 5 [Phyllozelus siccus siccus]